ncbi:TniQ family protein [Mangrovibrevibacter kandeliae]|uniref:TniQ family protein n=1 Tax=Mangrovibrevibacter kandeliae TaxID=2968473 RepID=UPI00211882BB|nr:MULTISPECIES: TniQ family protein [unclassified Aurantimonas]MCQ8781554.1 TniQ family protein [Aurantimonas sp. CSK15Z-1]MCW4114329.1 TniQ family protein [Aurantimonas sp. MSK8Z-1]
MRVHRNAVPPLGVGETAAGYCSRIAAQNGRTARQFCLDMGTAFQRVVDGSPVALARLAEAIGDERRGFPGIALRSIGSRMFDVDGEILSRACLRRETVRVCPFCLAEDIGRHGLRWVAPAHLRLGWMIRAVRSCGKHGVALVGLDAEPSRRALHDAAASLAGARDALPRLIADARPVPESAFETHVAARLGGENRGGWLGRLPLYADIGVCEILGAVVSHGPDVELTGLDETERRAAAAVGFRHASEGLAGIRTSLAEIAQRRPATRRAVGPKGAFGRLYDWLAHETDDPAYDPLRDVIRDYAIENMPLGPQDTVFGVPVPARKVHSIRSAAIGSASHPKRLRRLLKQAGLLDSGDAASGDRVLFPVDASAAFLKRIADAMSLKEAAAYLSIPRPHDRLLMEAGLLVPVLPGGYAAGIFHAFARSDLDGFLTRLLGGAAEVTVERQSQLRDIRGAMKACNCSAVEVVTLILDRRLPTIAVNPNAAGYMSVLVDPEELRPLVRGEEVDGMTLREVQTRLSLPTSVVRGLVDGGAIASFTALNPSKRCPQTYVRNEEVSRFQESYVMLGEISARLGVGTRTAMVELERAFIRPVLDRESIGAYVFDRSAFEALASRRPTAP